MSSHPQSFTLIRNEIFCTEPLNDTPTEVFQLLNPFFSVPSLDIIFFHTTLNIELLGVVVIILKGRISDDFLGPHPINVGGVTLKSNL